MIWPVQVQVALPYMQLACGERRAGSHHKRVCVSVSEQAECLNGAVDESNATPIMSMESGNCYG